MLAQFRKLTENNEWLQSLPTHTSFRWLMDALVVSFGAQPGTFLPIALIFGEIPVLAFATNLVILPLAGLAVVTALIISLTLPITTVLGKIYGQALRGELFLMDKVSLFMNHLPFQMISFHGGGIFPLIILFVGMIAWVSMSQNRYRFRSMLVCSLLGNFFIWTHILESPSFTITFMDVGQWDTCVIEDGGHTILFDGATLDLEKIMENECCCRI